jgi:hypothetical protein
MVSLSVAARVTASAPNVEVIFTPDTRHPKEIEKTKLIFEGYYEHL